MSIRQGLSFSNSQQLAEWCAKILKAAKIDELLEWSMLEYWFQAELWRAIKRGEAGDWKTMGGFEHPYFTKWAKGKTPWKAIDLALAEPDLKQPQKIFWIELKDLGRSEKRLIPNAHGVGHDLAALYGIDLKETLKGWQEPPAHMKDQKNGEQLRILGSVISRSSPKHLIGQIVIAPKDLIGRDKEQEILRHWDSSFQNKIGNKKIAVSDKTARADTEQISIFALMLEHELLIE